MPRRGQISSDEEAQVQTTRTIPVLLSPQQYKRRVVLSIQDVPSTDANKDANNEAMKGAFNGACMVCLQIRHRQTLYLTISSGASRHWPRDSLDISTLHSIATSPFNSKSTFRCPQ